MERYGSIPLGTTNTPLYRATLETCQAAGLPVSERLLRELGPGQRANTGECFGLGALHSVGPAVALHQSVLPCTCARIGRAARCVMSGAHMQVVRLGYRR